MIPFIEPVLYIDPQGEVPKKRCALCGERCFGDICLRCGRHLP